MSSYSLIGYKTKGHSWQVNQHLLQSKKILDTLHVTQCYYFIPRNGPTRIIRRFYQPHYFTIPYLPPSTYILLSLLLFTHIYHISSQIGITSSLSMKFNNISPIYQFAIKVPFSTARIVDLTIGSAKWGPYIDVLIPL